MTISELGAIGESVSAIAVVVTLAYLALQVKYSKRSLDENTRSLEANRQLALAAALDEHDRMFNDCCRMAVETPGFAERLMKMRNGDEPTEAEMSRYESWVNIALRTHQASCQRAKALGPRC